MITDNSCRSKFTRSAWHKENDSYKYALRKTKNSDTKETVR